VTAIDQHYAFLSDNDAAIGVEIVAHIHVDAFFDLFDIGRQFLAIGESSECDREECDDDQRGLRLHTSSSGETMCRRRY
jgi:hypothetical protein